MKLVSKFKENPMLYYALSICATWAGIGSLMNGVAMTQTLGVVPSAIWVLGNTLACIVFGLVATKIPKAREVFCSKVMMVICGIMCVFQSWLALNGIETVFSETSIGSTGGQIVAYVLSIGFLFILLKFGMIRNVLTDGVGWIVVYLLVVITTISALIYSRGQMSTEIVSGLTAAPMKEGIWKAILLLPGPFTYPYFFEILNYNDENADNTAKVLDIKKAFTLGGIFFGIYMLIVFPLAWAQFNPALSMMKAILITLIGTSTLSSAMYSIYIAFGKKLGLAVNAGLILGWRFLIPLGVMNMWTLMASVRIYFVGAAILFAIVWGLYDKNRTKDNSCSRA